MQIADVEGLEKFLAQMKTPGPEQGALIDRFGILDDNLDRAAEAIENFLIGQKQA
mgnify:FL=1